MEKQSAYKCVLKSHTTDFEDISKNSVAIEPNTLKSKIIKVIDLSANSKDYGWPKFL